MSGFVYLWFDRKYKRYYVGCHLGEENDSYICSSKWMLKSYRRRPEDFRRKILSRVEGGRSELYAKEHEWLSLIKNEELGNRYYNLTKTIGAPWNDELSTGQKISNALTGRKLSDKHKQTLKLSLKDRVFSDEHKRKLKEAWSDRDRVFTKEHREKLSKAHLGVKLSDEHRNSIIIVLTGRKFSDDTKNKLSEKAKKRPSTRCPFCGKEGPVNQMKQWHFEKCKHAS